MLTAGVTISYPKNNVNAKQIKQSNNKSKIKKHTKVKGVKIPSMYPKTNQTYTTNDWYNQDIGQNETGNSPWEMDNNQPIKDPTVNGNVIYYQNDTNDQFYQIINTAINNWNNLNVINLQLKPANYNGFYIDITNDISAHQSDFNGQRDAETYFAYQTTSTGPTMTSNTIIFDTSMFNTLGHNNDAYMLRAAEHEIGHALGFAHDPYTINHSNRPGDWRYAAHIMYPHNPDQNIPLGDKEANALRAVYNN